MSARPALATIAALVPLLAAAGVADTVAPPAQRSGLALTITQDDTALIRDRRTILLDKGHQILVFEGVARQARDSSAMLTGKGVAVTEQGFDLGGIDADRLLADAVGSEVTVVWRDGKDGEREERATVVAAGPTPVFQTKGKVVAGVPLRVLYDSLPPDIRPLPAYRAAIAVDGGGKRDVELAYLSSGLSWQADYVAEMVPGQDKLSLSAWATLTNNSGSDFPLARIQVMAGEVNRAADAAIPMVRAARMEKALMATAAAPTREAVSGYHLFSLAQPVSLKDGERRQVALMAPEATGAEQILVLDPMPVQGWRDQWRGDTQVQNPQMVVKLKNTTGQPLPSGTIRVYQRSEDGSAVFVGEDTMAATPVDGSARIALGKAFDVTAKRNQTDFNRVSADITEAAWEVRLTNAGANAAKVVVREAFGSDWLVLDESAKHAKENAFTAAWTVTVPAKGDTVVKYRVRVKG